MSRPSPKAETIKETKFGQGENATVHRFPGDHSERVPPVPIPNTEVKPLSPDCTARAGVWESRTSPG